MTLLRRLASALWSFGSALARGLASRGILLKPVRLGVRVISVGNLQVGGAGKTPLVAHIAGEALARGLKVCILCRGYGGTWERRGGVLPPGGEPPDPKGCGDEAALLHDLAPGAWLGIGSDRIMQFKRVTALLGRPPDLVVLDDGFQHWRVYKDVEVVAVTSRRRGEMLFRDWPRALERASVVVWTKGATPPDPRGRPLVRVRLALDPPEDPRRSLWIVTGVGDGRSVVDAAQASGYRIQRHVSFADHFAYREKQADELIRKAAASGCQIALTGKDWVKWRGLGIAASEVVVLEPKIVFEEGQASWEKALWGA